MSWIGQKIRFSLFIQSWRLSLHTTKSEAPAWDDLIYLIQSLRVFLRRTSLKHTFQWKVRSCFEVCTWADSSLHLHQLKSFAAWFTRTDGFLSVSTKNTCVTNYLLLCGWLHLSLSLCYSAADRWLLMEQRRFINQEFRLSSAWLSVLLNTSTRVFTHSLCVRPYSSWWITHGALVYKFCFAA